MKLIYLEWADSIANASWRTIEGAIDWAEIPDDWLVKEVGWIIKETKKYICIAGSWNPENERSEGQVSNLRKIPKTWIKKRVNLTKYIK